MLRWRRRCWLHEVELAVTGQCPECSRLRPGRQSEGVAVFDNVDDDGYRAWVGIHRVGYVLNMEKSYNPNYVILHQATCHTINGEPARGDVFVGGYVKVCAVRRGELEDWAINKLGTPSECEICF
ncbi:hypothetical protein AWB99_24015 [Mycolicibacterium confluentis]|nr:hypothetical protein AWB99_24015 [Mycolicibacterium confluentis]